MKIKLRSRWKDKVVFMSKELFSEFGGSNMKYVMSGFFSVSGLFLWTQAAHAQTRGEGFGGDATKSPLGFSKDLSSTLEKMGFVKSKACLYWDNRNGDIGFFSNTSCIKGSNNKLFAIVKSGAFAFLALRSHPHDFGTVESLDVSYSASKTITEDFKSTWPATIYARYKRDFGKRTAVAIGEIAKSDDGALEITNLCQGNYDSSCRFDADSGGNLFLQLKPRSKAELGEEREK
jgi:hypothetical protein